VDSSGGEAPFGGLTMMFLNLIANSPRRNPPAPSRVHSDRDGVSVLGRGASLFATSRIGRLWMAVRGSPSLARPTDMRYDGGLVALKLQRPDGTWADLISRRPKVPITGSDSAGPLLRAARGTAVFRTNRIRARRGGMLVARGGYYA